MVHTPGSRGDAPRNATEDWYEGEPRIGQVLIFELQRFKRRMKSRPLWVLVFATLLTAATLAWFTIKPKLYTARVVLRISEGALTQFDGPILPQDDLKSYIYDFALHDPLLLERVIQEHGFFRKELEKFGADMALEELRDGLSIDVFDNYFYFDRRYEIMPRSLRVAINYLSTDAEEAYRIARLLADLVIEVESRRRTDEVRYAANNAQLFLEYAEAEQLESQEQLNEVVAQLARAELAKDNVEAAMLRVEADALAQKILSESRQISSLRWEVGEIAFDLLLEEHHMGLAFEDAGEVRPQPQPPPGPLLLSLVGLACFCIFVPVCAVALGTMDSRIHEPVDVQRLSMPVMGHIPSFPGDEVGSLTARGALVPQGRLSRLLWGRKRRIRSTSTDRVA